MISLSIVSDIAATGWVETQAGWHCGPNRISLIDNRCLKRAMLVAEDGLIFIVAEQSVVLPSLSALTRQQVLSAFAQNGTGDGLLIYISDNRRVTLVRTAHATIPLYVSAEADRLNVGWDYNAVVAARGAVVLSRSELRCFILYGPQLAQETIVIGVKQVFAGQAASWRMGQPQIDIEPMVECQSLEQSVLSPGAHVTAVFLDLINLSCRALLQHAARPALELSGGMDSSCVAVALKAADMSFLSYALLHDGNAGHQQKIRREELLSQLDCTDRCISSRVCKPFTRLQQHCVEGVDCISVYDDLYWDGILDCLNAMPGDRPDLVITGIGGDELTITELSDATMTISARSTEALEALFFHQVIPTRRLPATGVSQSALSAAFVRAPLFLRQGIWPKNPFIDPRLAQFAQMLPLELKQNRLLNRLTLARSGLSDHFILPRFKENFKRVFMDDLMDFRGDIYWSESVLHTQMIANAAVLSNEIRDLQDSGHTGLSNYILINAVRAEFVVRHYCRHWSACFAD
ncbi:hypothetical protein [Ochrobactrum sp. AN78]|jgi:hypothetical protein|nr:hypothetical protein [Ochrobactrum sp. AN78]MDH7792500.1 hypothetical protein [Ochrobactrum sp. AN78]